MADDTASPALATLAADQATWQQMFLAGLEEGGLLRPEGDAPPIREYPQIMSLMSTLASGILLGAGHEEYRTTDSFLAFFDQIRTWYGHDGGLLADDAGTEHRVLVHLHHRLDQFGRSTGVADPESGHRVGLGKAVQENRPLQHPRK